MKLSRAGPIAPPVRADQMQKSAGRRSARAAPLSICAAEVTTKRSPHRPRGLDSSFRFALVLYRWAAAMQASPKPPASATADSGRTRIGKGEHNGNHAQVLAERRSRRSHGRGDERLRRRRGRYDQGRHPPFAVGHDGDQRDDPEGCDADADRRAQRQGRPARQEDRAGGGRPGLELAAVRREGARADQQGQGRGGVRLLDLGLAQIGAAGVRGAERSPLLSARIRGRGRFLQRLLRQLGAGQQSHPGRRISDERGGRRREAVRARRHRLRLSAHQQQDHPRLPQIQGRRRRGHPRELHAVRLLRLADRSRRRSRRSARPARRRRSSRPSTATPTFPSTRSSAIRG